MKRLIIICEGPTEVEFCKVVLEPFFLEKSIFIQTPLIKKSGGGIIPWPSLKVQIQKHLHEPDVFVTTLFDYYGIPDNYGYPAWLESKLIIDKNKRMDFLEAAMRREIHENQQLRFLPYLQLHEFEGLLFNNIEVFDQHISPKEFNTREELIRTIENFPNPELINDTIATAPSNRLKKLILGYNKVVYGSILAESIGLKRMREKSPRFNKWIEILSLI
jgi:hypothetical protein